MPPGTAVLTDFPELLASIRLGALQVYLSKAVNQIQLLFRQVGFRYHSLPMAVRDDRTIASEELTANVNAAFVVDHIEHVTVAYVGPHVASANENSIVTMIRSLRYLRDRVKASVLAGKFVAAEGDLGYAGALLVHVKDAVEELRSQVDVLWTEGNRIAALNGSVLTDDPFSLPRDDAEGDQRFPLLFRFVLMLPEVMATVELGIADEIQAFVEQQDTWMRDRIVADEGLLDRCITAIREELPTFQPKVRLPLPENDQRHARILETTADPADRPSRLRSPPPPMYDPFLEEDEGSDEDAADTDTDESMLGGVPLTQPDSPSESEDSVAEDQYP